MADLVIICTKDKQATAQRLKEAAARAGYDVGETGESGPQAEIAVADRIGSAKAAIVIWSRTSIAVEEILAAAAEARRQGKLIEVSADGVRPIGTPDDGRTALVSGWRGEPFHPGWQKVQAELKRLCGARKSAPADAAPRESRSAPASGAAPVTGAASNRPRPALIALFLLLFTSVAGAAWMSAGLWRAPEAPTAAPPPSPPPPAPAPAKAPVAAEPAEPSAAMPVAEAPAQTVRPETPVSEPETKPVKEASAAKSDAPQSRNSRNMRLFCEQAGRSTPECRSFRRKAGRDDASARAASAKDGSRSKARVRYRYSKNMRLFCEGAGRSTPECRVFRRNSGGGR